MPSSHRAVHSLPVLVSRTDMLQWIALSEHTPLVGPPAPPVQALLAGALALAGAD